MRILLWAALATATASAQVKYDDILAGRSAR